MSAHRGAQLVRSCRERSALQGRIMVVVLATLVVGFVFADGRVKYSLRSLCPLAGG